jgi:ABC-type glycerol-3-phosphate transport system substrate-binding protein
MNKSMLAFSAVLLAACGGMTEDQFSDNMMTATCDMVFECTPAEDIEAAGEYWFFGADSAECMTIMTEASEGEDTGDATVECVFDADAASACVDETNAMTCDDFSAGTYPAICQDVCVVAEDDVVEE